MVVLRALVDFELLDRLSAEGVFGQHAANRLIDHKVALLFQQLSVGNLFESADVTRVVAVHLVLCFFTR